jgi:hypothetical protein
MERFLNMVLSEKTHAKLTLGTFVSLLVIIIGGTWGGAAAYFKIKHGINNNTELIIYNDESIKENKSSILILDNDVDQVKINEAKIFTELANITNRQIRMLDVLENK